MRKKTKYFLLSVLFLACLSANLFAQSVLPLNPGSPISREFKSGEKHLFTITATEKEVIEITCERKGVDVALAAFAPNGKKITVSNSPGGFAGFDRLLFIAEKAGEYQIALDSRRPGNLSGSYTILLKEARIADETDANRAAAMKFLGEAREILFGAENRVEKADKAIESLKKSAVLFEKANDLHGQASAFFHIAYIIGNEYGTEAEALKFYEKALEIWTKIGDEANRAVSLTFAAKELHEIGDDKKSLPFLNEALLLNKKLNNRSGEAVTLSFMCRLYNDTQNFQKGFDVCRESLQIGQKTDPLTDYLTFTNLAALYENTGDSENSLKYYQISLERVLLVKNLLNPIRAATIRGNIGIIFSRQQNYAEAIQNYQEAVLVSEKVNRPKYTAYFLTQLSLIYFELNQFQKALEYGEKSLAMYRQYYQRNRQVALNAVSKAYIALGQENKARELFFEALEMNRENNDRYASAETLYNLAQLENRVGDLATAQQYVRQAVNISEILRAELFGKNQRSSYLTILKRYYELEIELLLKLQQKSANANLSEQAWQKHEKIRARSLLENFIEDGLSLNEIAPKEFFVKEQSLLEAIATAEFKRGEAVKTKNLDAQKESEIALQKALDDYQILQEEIRQKNPKFSALNHPKEFSFADVQKLLDEETSVLEFTLGEQQSYAWLIRKNSVKLVKLPPKNILNQTAREFYLALTNRDTKSDAAVNEKSKQLSRQILQPFTAELANVKRLVVIADGALQMIPFSALTLTPDTAFQPLIENIEIVNAPSFSSLVFLRENKANRQISPDKLLAIFADPIFQNDDERFAKNKTTAPKTSPSPIDETAKLNQTLRDFGIDTLARLPFTSLEAREIAKFAPDQTILSLGADASRQTFLRGDFNSYRILHFATHGFLDQKNPDLSGLVLSLFDENRIAQNGFLRVIDLYSLKLNADLVVLSACQTALGKEVDGEGIVGLTRGFMYAGASGVVSSLWKVEDMATAELMKRFYREMLQKKQSPSTALRIAQNELRRIPRFRSPNNWAGFTLNGEWR